MKKVYSENVMWKRMLKVGDAEWLLEYTLKITQHWNELTGWIIGVGVEERSINKIFKRGNAVYSARIL